MKNQERGCVYFFKHIGIDPIKIGFSTSESPIDRLESFKTYAPYGAELIGFIRTRDAKMLESLLHKKFSSNRLNGEWFDISMQQVKGCIKYYSSIEDQNEQSLFNIEFAKKIAERYKNKNERNYKAIEDRFNSIFSIERTEYFSIREIINKGQLMKILECDKIDIEHIFELYNLKYSTKRNGDKIKKGIELFTKENCIQ